MSGTYVSQNGTGEFEIRPFQIEGICNANEGHSHNYDHWMRILRGGVQIEVREPAIGDEPGELLDTIIVRASDTPTVECVRFNGEIQLFHAFVAATKWHKVKAIEPNTSYECCFLHRDFDTGEVVQHYNGNPMATT